MKGQDDVVKAAVRLALQKDRAMESDTPSLLPKAPSTTPNPTPGTKPASNPKRKRTRSEGIDSNWKALQKTLGVRTSHPKKRRKWKPVKEDRCGPAEQKTKKEEEKEIKHSAFMKRRVTVTDEMSKVVALDCEMVGIGPDGREDALARASVVNYSGDVLYDKYVRVQHEVTDYRTQWSGIRAEDIAEGAPNVVELDEAQRAIGELIRGRVLVGHALKNDLRVLRLKHCWRDVRDTSNFYRKLWKREKGRRSAAGPALRVVVASVLGVDTFQGGEHDSCEDARAALMLYKKNRADWEREIRERKMKRGRGKEKAEHDGDS